MTRDRLARSAAVAVVASALAIAFAGFTAGAIRLMPWLLDPAVPWRVARPFARGLAAVAVESALLVGWPVGWSFACFRALERGEARVFQTLGQRPAATLARLVPEGLLFAATLAAVAVVYGRDTGSPGRVATELVSESRAACMNVLEPVTYAVPFTSWTWLCAPGAAPHLVGSPPGRASSGIVSAAGARMAGDLRSLELDDARLVLPGPPAVVLRAKSFAIRGLSAWAQASILAPAQRAIVLVVTAWACAWLSGVAALRGAASTRAGALALGASGPLSALGAMRFLERMGGAPWAFAAVPLVGMAAVAAAVVVMRVARRVVAVGLRTKLRAATT